MSPTTITVVSHLREAQAMTDLVGALDGTFAVHSRAGTGTTVQACLPLP
jgi:hypothetical protein